VRSVLNPDASFRKLSKQAFLSRSITALGQKPAFDTPIAKPAAELKSSTEFIITIVLINGGY
jgi:hypothetical protein